VAAVFSEGTERIDGREAPRCSAMSKRSRRQCQAPAERGKSLCRFHGARADAPSGMANGNYRHGDFVKEAIAERRALTKLLREPRVRSQMCASSVNCPFVRTGSMGLIMFFLPPSCRCERGPSEYFRHAAYSAGIGSANWPRRGTDVIKGHASARRSAMGAYQRPRTPRPCKIRLLWDSSHSLALLPAAPNTRRD